MPAASPTVFRWADIELDKVTEMVSRKEIRSDGDSFVQTYLKKGALVPAHTHSGPQWIYVLQGMLLVETAGESVTLHEGDVLHVPPGARHQGEALDDTFVLDIKRN